MSSAILAYRYGLIAALTFLMSATVSGEPQPATSPTTPISEIRMRLQSVQVFADDEITVRSDGSATYVRRRGYYLKPKVTKQTAQLQRSTFERLVALLDKGGIEQLTDKYESTRTHQTLYAIVIKRGDQERTISDYGQVGPPALWGFEMVVEHLIDSTWWR